MPSRYGRLSGLARLTRPEAKVTAEQRDPSYQVNASCVSPTDLLIASGSGDLVSFSDLVKAQSGVPQYRNYLVKSTSPHFLPSSPILNCNHDHAHALQQGAATDIAERFLVLPEMFSCQPRCVH